MRRYWKGWPFRKTIPLSLSSFISSPDVESLLTSVITMEALVASPAVWAKTAGGALGCDQDVELVEHDIGQNRQGRLADIMRRPGGVQMVRTLGVPIGVKVVAKARDAGLSVVGVAAQIQALSLLSVAERMFGPVLGEREGDSLVGVSVLVHVGIGHKHCPHMDQPQWRIVFPARALPAADIQQVPAGVQQRIQLFEAARDEGADVRHRGVLPEKGRKQQTPY